jgi:hypothetical protein
VVSFTPRPLYSWKYPRYPLDTRLDGLQSRSGRGGEEENWSPCRETNPYLSALTVEITVTKWTMNGEGLTRKPYRQTLHWENNKNYRCETVAFGINTDVPNKFFLVWWQKNADQPNPLIYCADFKFITLFNWITNCFVIKWLSLVIGLHSTVFLELIARCCKSHLTSNPCEMYRRF